MKELLMKHPFWSLCIVYTVCRTVENIALNERTHMYMGSVGELINDSACKILEKDHEEEQATQDEEKEVKKVKEYSETKIGFRI